MHLQDSWQPEVADQQGAPDTAMPAPLQQQAREHMYQLAAAENPDCAIDELPTTPFKGADGKVCSCPCMPCGARRAQPLPSPAARHGCCPARTSSSMCYGSLSRRVLCRTLCSLTAV